jgi:hypothetical protein
MWWEWVIVGVAFAFAAACVFFALLDHLVSPWLQDRKASRAWWAAWEEDRRRSAAR